VDEGIILEDDCLPDPTFFPFCEELLRRYRDEPRISMISGDNFQGRRRWTPDSYYFSVFHHVWGWASWSKRWADYQLELGDWQAFKLQNRLRTWLGSDAASDYWTTVFDSCANGALDTWDFQWAFSCWRKERLAILPSSNLVRNIGFDDRATHTHVADERMSTLSVATLSFPLKHPSTIQVDRAADRRSERDLLGIRHRRTALFGELRPFLSRIASRFGANRFRSPAP
jgi:hypothetical protein